MLASVDIVILDLLTSKVTERFPFVDCVKSLFAVGNKYCKFHQVDYPRIVLNCVQLENSWSFIQVHFPIICRKGK